MARGGAHTPTPAVPKASFTKVEDTSAPQLAGVHDLQARSYGYNDFQPFQRPEHYIRYIEPLEIDLAKQVEYDMDEQDQEWLDAVNAERHAEQMSKVSPETFEIIMDRLEKEWYDLTKNIPKPDMALPSEDSTCAICDDAEGENANAIVFCDGCNLAVHQDCYGVPYIPEGQWLCRKCTVSPENPVSCILCPNEGGAFKQTVSGDWAHLLCAIWVPETRVANDVFMEPITGVDRISKQRWKLKCSLCDTREGACIQCSKSSCFLAFHATCARREKLLMPMKSAHGQEPATLAAYCEKHLPKEQFAAHEAAVAELAGQYGRGEFGMSDGEGQAPTPRTSKKARAYAKTYKLGAPLVPAIIVERIMQYISRIRISKKEQFVHMMCRYWSLKREARRGAPLLKRLHLEPWSASAVGKIQNEEEMVIKLGYLKRLRKDLEAVRMLAELVRKRETQKLKQAQIQYDVFSSIFYPHIPMMRHVFERIAALDRHGYFKNPVSKAEVPDYFDVIKKPMCWNTIEAKLDANVYWNVKDFQDDIELVVNNAMQYNKSDSPFYRTASRMKNQATALLDELKQLARDVPSDSPEAGRVGDLEPPLELLDLLLSKEAVDGSELPLVLDKEPLASLFAFELGKIKPPPPQPTPPPPKPKRDRKAEAERRRQRFLDSAPGFRAPIAPRTRREHAHAEAFEAEARGTSSGAETGTSPIGGEGDEESASTRSKRGKREKVVLPGQSEVPPVVDDVDMQKSFNMFDRGWILPPSTRRGGRAPVEKQDLPPPRKRQRTERRRSTLSVSTPVEDNLTLQDSSTHAEEGSSEIQHKREKSETVDLSDPRLVNPYREGSPHIPEDASTQSVGSFASPPPDSEPVPDSEPEGVANEDGEGKAEEEEAAAAATKPDEEAAPEPEEPAPRTMRTRKRRSPRPTPIIIEELDTPAIRRAKHYARKQRKAEERERAERERQAQNATASASATEPGQDQGSGSAVDQPGKVDNKAVRSPVSSPLTDPHAVEAVEADEAFSDLTSLSETAEGDAETEAEHTGTGTGTRTDQRETPDGRRIVKAEDARKAAQSAGLGAATVLLKEGEVLEGGTLVWAKAETYPWWPSVVFEEDDPEVPPNVLEDKPATRAGVGPLILVRFWDTRQSWQWLPMEKMRLLASDKGLDDLMLNGNSKTQRFKSAKVKEQCREAWKQAIAEMETNNAGNDDDDQEVSPDDDQAMVVENENET
ncbi:hypothetical protein ACEPAI_4087 [Sanghuangporus weigelae]